MLDRLPVLLSLFVFTFQLLFFPLLVVGCWFRDFLSFCAPVKISPIAILTGWQLAVHASRGHTKKLVKMHATQPQ